MLLKFGALLLKEWRSLVSPAITVVSMHLKLMVCGVVLGRISRVEIARAFQ
jgi:hypothetical protein